MTTVTRNISFNEALPALFSAQFSANGWFDGREAALKQFLALGGIPTVKTEDWKYTNVVSFFKNDLQVTLPEVPEVTAAQLEATGLILPDTFRLVLVNGVLQPHLSQLPPASQVTISKLSEAGSQPAVELYFNQSPRIGEHHFAQLNSALFNDGLFIEVKAKAQVELPVQIIHLYAAGQARLFNPRHLVVVNEGAALQIVESAAGIGLADKVVINSVMESVVAERAQFSQYQLQTGGNNLRTINQNLVEQKGKSVYNNYTFTLTESEFVRNNLNISLDEERTETHMYGFYIAAGGQLIDNHTSVDHRMPNCESNELYRGVLMDKSTGVFNGKIYVHEDAQKTNAFQQNNNLVISPEATIFTKPQLEIFADDVKCSHGCTIGQVSEDALFYLRARGIGEAEARNLLVKAFAFDITAKVNIPAVRKQVEQLASQYLNA
ncbi:Fe-S cluster assembly protein SufD [Chitinophaga deserti]|uniref:Fe-S cluster assembly protein SufD n=1 Tax=Chitinophaga deserti TaxID=2164099 RepID=UPI000D6A81F9|nr:Fe-S cluster assembly protein SufD [Chitinophaga deserti]